MCCGVATQRTNAEVSEKRVARCEDIQGWPKARDAERVWPSDECISYPNSRGSEGVSNSRECVDVSTKQTEIDVDLVAMPKKSRQLGGLVGAAIPVRGGGASTTPHFCLLETRVGGDYYVNDPAKTIRSRRAVMPWPASSGLSGMTAQLGAAQSKLVTFLRT